MSGWAFGTTTFGLRWSRSPKAEARYTPSLATLHAGSIAQIHSISTVTFVHQASPKMDGCKAAYTGVVNTSVYDDLRESSRSSSHGARTRALQTRSLFSLAGRRVDSVRSSVCKWFFATRPRNAGQSR